MQKHFVTFYSPGTFVAETTESPIDSWDTEKALEMAAKIVERHNATPYGFRFTTRKRKDDELDSKVIKTSPMYYIGGKVRTLAQVKKDNLKSEKILRTNMECNKFDRIWQTTEGWSWTQPLMESDIVLKSHSTEGGSREP